MVDFALKYPWQAVIMEAFLAPPADLSIKISVAEQTISARIRESEIDFSERMALDDDCGCYGFWSPRRRQ
jgi:hypothetical protein